MPRQEGPFDPPQPSGRRDLARGSAPTERGQAGRSGLVPIQRALPPVGRPGEIVAIETTAGVVTYFYWSGTAWAQIATGAAHDLVTLGDAQLQAILTLTGQALTMDTQLANTVLAGPAAAPAAKPAFRVLVEADVPATIARDSEVTSAITTHETAADPHTVYVREADPNWTDLTDAGQTSLHSHAGGGDTGIFLLLAGRAGGQAPIGGVAASENLLLESTSHATKGEVQVVDGSAFGARKMYGNYVGQAGGLADTMLHIRNQSASESVSLSKNALLIAPSWAPSADSLTFIGISGNALISNAGRLGTNAQGLDFVALAWQGAFATLIGAQVRPQKFASQATTITALEGFRVQPNIGANATITQYASFRSLTPGNSGMATAIGLKIDDITLGANKYLIEVGPTTPNLRVEATTPGTAGAPFEDSRVLIAFRDSAGVVTLRRLYTLPFSSLGAADKVVVAI